MMWHIAGQDCCTSHCPFSRAMAASQPDKFATLGLVCYCSAHGFYSLHSWASLVIAVLAHKASNHSMKPVSSFSKRSAQAVNLERRESPQDTLPGCKLQGFTAGSQRFLLLAQRCAP